MLKSQIDTLTYVCLILIIFILMFFACIILLILVKNFKKVLKSSRSYYLIIVLMLAVKVLVYLVYGLRIIEYIASNTNSSQQISDTHIFQQFIFAYENLMYLTDVGLILLLLIICNKYIVFSCRSVLNRTSQQLSKFILITQVVLFLGLSIFIIVYNINKLSFYTVLYVFAISNFFSVFCLFVTHFYLNIKLVGTLVENEIEQLLKHFKKIQLAFFLSRGVEGVYSLLIAAKVEYINFILGIETTKLQALKLLLLAALYLVLTFITEGIPLILSVNQKTIIILQQDTWRQGRGSLLTENQNNFISYLDDSSVFDQAALSMKNVVIQSIISQTQTGFGTVKLGKFNSRPCVVRQINSELSKYLIEQVANEIEDKKQNKIHGLLNIQYFIVQKNKIYFISDFMKSNLQTYLSNLKRSQLANIKLSLKISDILYQLHKRDLPHGCLKLNNIFIQKQQVLISDHGLLSLKKFINLTKGYSNKSIFTAPQFLTEKTAFIAKPTKQSDIYALGMLMYQIFTGIQDYRNLSIKQIQKSFRDNKTRPKIPQNVPNNVRNLIRSCWQQEPMQRPSIEEVRGFLKQYSKN